MPIDAAQATAAEPRTSALAWGPKDVQLYHLGVGAGAATPEQADAATDPDELRYVLEDRLHVLPSFATVAGAELGVVGGLDAPGIDVDLTAVLHGTQKITLHRPLPTEGVARRTATVPAVYDKGTAAVVVLHSEVADDDGPLWTSDAQMFVRGEGGWGGDRGPAARLAAPEREPDRTVTRPVRPDQALLYRLSGDVHPLHADPDYAARAGFDRPILHGLCSYGVALKAAVDTLLDGAVGRVRSYAARFAGVAFPGETLRIRMWRDAPEAGRIQLTATAVERDDAPVLTDTVVELV